MGSLKDMMEQVKKLKSGEGVQSLIDAAYSILGNPIAMFNTDYNLLAHIEVETDDPVWNEIVDCGTFGKETKKLFEDEGFIEEVANSQKIILLRSERLKYERILGKLFNKNNAYVANLMIVAHHKPFEDNDLAIFEIICKLVSREISKDEFYQRYEQEYQEKLIKHLIDSDCETKLDMVQTEILYASLGPNLYIAVADVSQNNGQIASAESLRDLFKKVKPKYKYALYSGYIVMIVSTDAEALDVSGEFKELIKLFGQYNIYAGISGRFENLFGMNKRYAEALKSLSCVLENRCSQRIFPYNPDSPEIMQRISGLPNGRGIQFFLNKGPEIFGNPLLFHDVELNLLAYTENYEIIDPIWKELIAYGTSSDETINLFDTEGFIQTMESTKGGALLVSDKIKYDRISWKIYNSDKIMIGCVSIVNTNKQFSEDEVVLFGALGQKFSNEIKENEFYSNYGQVYSGTVINRLIGGKIDDYTFYTMDIGNLYNNLLNNLYLVAVDASQCGQEHSITYFRSLFNLLGTVNRYAIYSGYTVVIISSGDIPLHGNKAMGEIREVFDRQNIYAGVSGCFENIYDLQEHYAEAVEALKAGIKGPDNKQRIFYYDEPAS